MLLNFPNFHLLPEIKMIVKNEMEERERISASLRVSKLVANEEMRMQF